MRPRLSVASLLVAAAALAGCSDGTAPITPDVTATRLLFCPGWQPDWVAFQDGDGPWSNVPVKFIGKFARFDYNFTANRGGLAMGRNISSASTPQLSVRFGTPAELELLSDTLTGGCAAANGRSWHGLTSGLELDEVALVGLGSSGPQPVSASTDFAYTIDGIAAGPQTIFAQQIRTVDNQQVLAAAILRHGVDLPDGATLPLLDFKSDEVILPTDATMSVTGLAGATAVVSAGFFSQGSITALSYGSPALVGDGPTPYRLLPASALGAGDLQFLNVSTQPNGSNRNRTVISFFHEPPAAPIAMGDLPIVAEMTVVSGTRLRARFPDDADYDQLASVTWQQSAVQVAVAMTGAYAALSERGYDLAIPDFSAVQGFGSQWLLTAGRTAFWSTGRVGGNISLALDPTIPDGGVRRVLVDFGTFRP
jgi:hypothetical protein